MGCRCKERSQAIGRGVRAAARGDVATVRQAAGFVGRTLVQDARSGDLQRAVVQKLAQLRQMTRRR